MQPPFSKTAEVAMSFKDVLMRRIGGDLEDELVIQAARTAHEVNRAYCATLGDLSQKPFAEAPEHAILSVIDGVGKIFSGAITSPEESHANWLAVKEADGWVYGETKDETAKTHPCMVPYDQLPPEQQYKDALFFAVVMSFLD